MRRTGPGIGEILSLALLDDIHAIHRCPRGQECVSDCRLVNCATESAGTRDGTGGTKSGHADHKWAFSAAPGRFWRDHPSGQKDLARWEKTPGQGKAWTVLAQHLARAVYSRLRRATAFNLDKVSHGERRGAGEPDALLDSAGVRLDSVR